MDLIKNVRSFLLEDDFAIHIYKNKVNVMNYTSIGHFDTSKVIIRYDQGEFMVRGENLVVSKLLHDEILVSGVIKAIEFR